MQKKAGCGLLFQSESEDETARLARAIGLRLGAGDTLLLEGPIGSGKSFFARALIQDRMAKEGAMEDVPSPTFTLVQTYDFAGLEVWHADLYRLSGPDEVHEIGLVDAMDEAICLVEWPDRLGPDLPSRHLAIRFETGRAPGQRHLALTPVGDGWSWLAHAIDEARQ